MKNFGALLAGTKYIKNNNLNQLSALLSPTHGDPVGNHRHKA